ncbi:MAG TPA: AI-2E family transporter [Gemmataceae bacterium]|nr:AI-2E family transporter [Gemmataceae bacterium]
MATRLGSNRWQRSLAVLTTFVVVVLVIACLYLARSVLIPVALAILLTFLLSPLVTALQRRGLRRVPAVIVVVALTGLLLGGLGWLLADRVASLANDLPAHRENITRKLNDLRGLGKEGTIEKVSRTVKEVAKELEKDSTPTDPDKKVLPVPPIPVKVVEDAPLLGLETFLQNAGPLLEPLASAGLVVVLVIFMLVQREDLRNRLIRLFGHGHLTVTTKALDEAGQRISRYLLMQLIINSTFGLAIGVGLFFIGVPYALLWGFLAAVLRYIPYVGPWVAALLALAMTLITFEGWTPLLVVLGLFLVCELISNMVMEPLLYGQSIGVSEAALLVAVAFWTWVWGPVGLVLAAPLTVCLVVLGKYVPHLEFFDILLGARPVLGPDVRYYQRLLARDQDEAADVAAEQLRASSLEQVYDHILIPALTAARRDLENERLTEDEAQFVITATREIAEELAVQAREQTPVEEAGAAPLPVVSVMACPARDEADEAALVMLRNLLEPAGCRVEVMTSEMLASEVISKVGEERPPLICVASLPPGGLAHTRYLCLRLRSRHPGLKVAVGRWGPGTDREKDRDRLQAAGADYLGTTLQETRNQILEFVRVFRHRAQSETTGEAVVVAAAV